MRAYEEYKKIGLPWLEEIPAHWKVVRNKNVLTSETETVGNESHKYQLLSLSQHGVIIRDVESGKGKFPKEFDTYKIVKPNRVIFCLFDMDETPRTVGLSSHHGMITGAYDVFCVSGVNEKYLYYYYLALDNVKALKPLYTGLRKVISSDRFLSMSLPLPPREEQDAIVRFLDAKCAKIDSLIKLKERQIELLNEKKQNIINQAVTKGLDPHAPMKDSGVDWIGDIPKEIVISRVGLHYEVILGKMLCPSKQAENFSLEPYYCAANVHFEGISSENLKEMWFSPEEKIKYTVQQNDLLIVEGGAGAGGCAIVTSETPKACIQNSIMIVRNPDGETRYLGYLIESLVRRGYIDFVCQKATIPHFTKEKLCAVPYPVFSKEERCRIADYLDNITTSYQRKTRLVQKEISILQEYKTRIISDVVTGKIAI